MTGINQSDSPVRVRLTTDAELAKAYALTLTAMDMNALISTEEGGFGVYVTPADVLRAGWELDQYDAENNTAEAPARHQDPPVVSVSFMVTALAYAAVLTFFFGAARQNWLEIDWAGEGAMVAYHVISDLQLWRTVTALLLHLDPAHLAANLAFGIVFVWLLAKQVGSGISWLSVLFAGAAGNLANAMWQSPTHTSIGASTAVFGAIGLLAALRHQWRPPKASLRYWAPLGGGLMLMVFLGFGTGNVDYGAHVLGFAAGIAGGWLLSRKEREWFANGVRQIEALKLTVFILVSSWALALAF